MNLDILIKYLTWITFFVLVLTGLYFALRRIGVL